MDFVEVGGSDAKRAYEERRPSFGYDFRSDGDRAVLTVTSAFAHEVTVYAVRPVAKFRL